MSRKSLVPALLALVFSMILVSVNTSSSVPVITQTDSATTVYLDPPTVYLDTPTINGTAVNQTFTVNINITDAINITDWGIGLRFDPAFLECTGFSQGEFLQSVGPTYWTPGPIDNTAGVVEGHSCNLKGLYWANGSGRLAYATFRVKALGVSDIHFRDITVMTRVYDELSLKWVPVMISFNIIDVYTVVLDTTAYTVVTVSNSTGVTGNYGSGFYDHAFSIPDKEISFSVSHAGRDPSDPNPSFSNVTIPKTLMWVDALENWKVIIDGVESSITVTSNGTHDSLYFTYPLGIHKIQITSDYVTGGRELVASLEAPFVLKLGSSSLLNATVYNLGFSNETNVELFLLINGTVPPGGNVTIPFLEIGSNYTFSYLWTPPAVEADYNVTAYTPPVFGENVTTNNVATTFVMVRRFYIAINPDSGPIGTKATVSGTWFSPQSQMFVTFNDMQMGSVMTDEFGSFTFVFNVPVSVVGVQTVKAYEAANLSNYAVATFTVIDVTPLDIKIDVGAMHFRGESAEFYVQIAFKGTAVNATSISALLYKPDGTTQSLTVSSPIATGVYKITYAIPVDAQNGTYALVVEADYTTSTIVSHGTALKTFLLSSTLAEELALIEDLRNETENLKAEIAALNTALNSLNETFTEELKAQIAILNTTLNSLNETIAQLETRIDTIKSAQEAFTPPLYAAVVLALVAAVGAIVTLLRRKPTP